MDEQIPVWAQTLIREVTILNERLPNHVDWTERNIKDHEVRIRDLERNRWTNAWISTAAGVALAGVVAFIVSTIFKG